MLPTLPPWTGLHPLVVHFPIALLLMVPLLILLSMIARTYRHGLSMAAWTLMLVGTIGAVVAVSTGEAAGELAERAGGVAAALERHEELADTTRTAFVLLTGMFTAMLAAPLLRRKEWTLGMHRILSLVFLAFYAGGMVVLANTAHQGGQLVHQFGVRAMLGASAAADAVPGLPSQGTNTASAMTASGGDDDDDDAQKRGRR